MNAKFLSYLVKRLLMALLTIFLVVAITFFVMHAIPASPFSSEKAKSDAVIAALEAKYGFDKPVPVQFLNYLTNILHGDFGLSTGWVGNTVIDLIMGGSGLPGGDSAGFLHGQDHPGGDHRPGGHALLRAGDDPAAGVLAAAGLAALHGQSAGRTDPAHHFPQPVSHGLYHPPAALLHAGRAGAGLHPHRPGQGREKVQDHLQARAEKHPDTRHHLRGPNAARSFSSMHSRIR